MAVDITEVLNQMLNNVHPAVKLVEFAGLVRQNAKHPKNKAKSKQLIFNKCIEKISYVMEDKPGIGRFPIGSFPVLFSLLGE